MFRKLYTEAMEWTLVQACDEALHRLASQKLETAEALQQRRIHRSWHERQVTASEPGREDEIDSGSALNREYCMTLQSNSTIQNEEVPTVSSRDFHAL
jgi:hypothetical protein